MKKVISLVLPVYNEAGNLRRLQADIDKNFTSLKKHYDLEIIYVNDGSIDESGQILTELARHNSQIIVINLSRNFGHQLAITAGLDYAHGNAVITMDSDGQDPPAVCQKLIKKWEAGFDIVYAERRKRAGESAFKRLSAAWFYRFINRIADTNIPTNVGDFRLLDGRVVTELKKFGEHQRFLRGLVSYLGFKQTTVGFDRLSRQKGQTSYSLPKMWRLATDGITGFSTAPIRYIARLGYFMAGLSLVGIVYAVWVKLAEPARAVPGWAFVTVSIFFIGGVQLIMLGVIGGYIARTYTEAQNRPLYIISSLEGKKSHQPTTHVQR